MNDQELRALVRAAIAKQMGEPAPATSPSPELRHALHPSHWVHALDDNAASRDAAGNIENGPCVIEPSVPCTHCNYCKSHGH